MRRQIRTPAETQEQSEVIKIPLQDVTQAEELAWLCTAIIAHRHMNVRLTDRSKSIIDQIKSDSVRREEFETVLQDLMKENKYGIVEILPDEGEWVRKFVLG